MAVVFSRQCSFSLQVLSSEKKPLHLQGHLCLSITPLSMISCTPEAARRITASFFHSLPEPWRMDGMRGGQHHPLPSTPHPCGHRLSQWGLSRTNASTSLCLYPLSPTPGPQAAPEELFPASLLTETLRWVYRLCEKTICQSSLLESTPSLREGMLLQEPTHLTWL